MKNKSKEECLNCGGDGCVPVLINCPECKGNRVNELDALCDLADWIENNFHKRTRAPRDGMELLNRVRKAQGRK